MHYLQKGFGFQMLQKFNNSILKQRIGEILYSVLEQRFSSRTVNVSSQNGQFKQKHSKRKWFSKKKNYSYGTQSTAIA